MFRKMVEKNPDKYGKNCIELWTKKYGENCGVLWTDNEEKKLLKLIDENKTIEQISIEHKRTIGAIRARLRKIARALYSHGKTISEIKDKLKLFSIDTISLCVKKSEKNKSNKKNDDDIEKN